jgi:hypothetical protein
LGGEQPTGEDEDRQKLVKSLLDNLHNDSTNAASDEALGALSWHNFPALRHARAKLTIKCKDKALDVFFYT